MSEVKWIKVSTDMFDTSRKVKQIELMPEGDTILVIWLKLMLLAGQINDSGRVYVTKEIPYTDEMLANELRRPLATVKIALSVFERFGMISFEDGAIRLTSWEKYQNVGGLEKIREQNRQRKQRQREKEKLLLSEDISVSRDGHGAVTPCHAIEEEREEDIDKEKDKEKERKRESDALTHSDLFDSDLDAFSTEQEQRDRAKIKRLGGSLGQGVVLLSDAQMDHLLDVLSGEEFDHYVSVIAENELKGRKYKRKTHYQAILDMAQKDRRL